MLAPWRTGESREHPSKHCDDTVEKLATPFCPFVANESFGLQPLASASKSEPAAKEAKVKRLDMPREVQPTFQREKEAK
jgi:hypothetical protein